MKRTIPLLLCVLWWPGTGLLAQEAPLVQGLRLDFDRQNNFTYVSRLTLGYEKKLDKLRLEARLLQDNLYSTAVTGSGFVQLNVYGDLWLYRTLRPGLEVAGWLETQQFWNTRNQRHSLYAGLAWQPHPGIVLTPLIGYSWDYRSRSLDQGISPALRVKAYQDLGEGLELETEGFFRVKYIEPRHQRNALLAATVSKTFSENAGIALVLRGGSNQMDDYKSQSVESIKSDTAAAQLSLSYALLPGLNWESYNEGSFSRRRLDYLAQGTAAEYNNLKFDQADFRTRQKLSFSARKFNMAFTYEYLYLGRRYLLENNISLPEREFQRLAEREMQKDYYRRQTSFDLIAAWQAKPRHVLGLTGSNRYLQYDTPTATNYDDHDELTYSLGADWRAQWTAAFYTRYRLYGNVRRYAFLFGERSQDNYTQRTLRLDFEYRWDPTPRLRLKGEQYLYVVYNVKDFEDRNRTDRSNRTLDSRFTANWRISPRWDTEWSAYRKEVHVSYLNWDAFAETTLDTTYTWLGSHLSRMTLKLKNPALRLQVEAGYRHFSQIRRLNTSMTSLQLILTPVNLHIRVHQTGPVSGLILRHRSGHTLEGSVWWQWQYNDFKYQVVDAFTTLSANYREDQLQEVLIKFRPFIKLQANISLGRPPAS